MFDNIDDEVDSWMFMSSPWPIFTILSLYLLFVLKLGPNFMESRKPFSLKTPILLYNVFQTLYNAWLVSMVSYLFLFIILNTYDSYV